MPKHFAAISFLLRPRLRVYAYSHTVEILVWPLRVSFSQWTK